MIRLLCLLLALLSPAFASATPADVSLLSGWRMENGRHMAGLRIRLDAGWKTYWRAPGEAGIPPLLDWSGSTNVSGVTIHWPAPGVYQSAGMRVIAYKDEVILPLELHVSDPAQPVQLNLRADFGACQDICMPLSAALQTALPAPGDRHPGIVAALLDQPQRGPGQMTCEVAAAQNGLRVSVAVPHAPADAVIEVSDPAAWVSQPSVRPHAGGLRAEAIIGGQGVAVDRSSLRLTLLPASGPAVEYIGCE